MRKFIVKGSDHFPEILTITGEENDNFLVLLEKSNGYGIEKRSEILPKVLFESCLRTNYLTEVLSA